MKKLLNFTAEKKDIEDVKRICREEDIPVSQVMRKLLREWLKERNEHK